MHRTHTFSKYFFFNRSIRMNMLCSKKLKKKQNIQYRYLSELKHLYCEENPYSKKSCILIFFSLRLGVYISLVHTKRISFTFCRQDLLVSCQNNHIQSILYVEYVLSSQFDVLYFQRFEVLKSQYQDFFNDILFFDSIKCIRVAILLSAFIPKKGLCVVLNIQNVY